MYKGNTQVKKNNTLKQPIPIGNAQSTQDWAKLSATNAASKQKQRCPLQEQQSIKYQYSQTICSNRWWHKNEAKVFGIKIALDYNKTNRNKISLTMHYKRII